MHMPFTHSRLVSLVLTIAWTNAGLSIVAIPTQCWGQFGGAKDSTPVSSPQAAFEISGSLPVKSARSERIEQEILARLNQTTSLTLKQSRLDVFIHEVALAAGIQVQIDHKALREANVSLDTRISVDVEHAMLRSTLDIVLRPLDLRWVIANDMVMITTKDVADDMTEVRVYLVRDLVVYGKGPNADFNSLIDLIQNTIRPDSWTATGGPGAIERFYKNYSLVVNQTREVHEQIELLLAQLRRVSDRHGVWGISDRKASAVPEDRPSGVRELPPPVRVYRRVSTGGLVRVHQ